MYAKVFFGITAFLACSAALLLILARFRSSETERRVQLMNEVTLSSEAPAVSFRSLAELPPPVQKYFRRVLRDGQPQIRRAFFTQSGDLKINPGAAEWSPFSARQFVSIRKPGFLWNAKIEIAPLLHVNVVDSYVDGTGAGSVALLSAVPMGADEDHTRLNSAALYRYLAEAVWYPTALLPENGVRWRPVDDRRARAIFTDAGLTASIVFSFNKNGEIEKLYATERYGQFDGTYIQYPWEGRFGDYIEKEGMMIPAYGQIGWHLPDGYWLFWKGRVESIRYDFFGVL